MSFCSTVARFVVNTFGSSKKPTKMPPPIIGRSRSSTVTAASLSSFQSMKGAVSADGSASATAIFLKKLTSYRDSHIFRIDEKYYDLTNFVDRHPGGSEFLRYAKIKAWDHTQLLSVHHLNYSKISMIMKQYQIRDHAVIDKIKELEMLDILKYWPTQLPRKESRFNPLQEHEYPDSELLDINACTNDPKNIAYFSAETAEAPLFGMEVLNVADYHFELPLKGTFYYTLREKVHKYFKANNLEFNRPTNVYLFSFWCILILMAVCTLLQSYFRSYLLAMLIGLLYAWLGGYAHQFCHLPNWRRYAHILDWMGLYSHAYMCDHVFVHHIYTNTIADNHFVGTDPFLCVHPFFQRQWFRKTFNFVAVNLTLLFGVFGNFVFNLSNIFVNKAEEFHWCMLLFPCNYILHMLLTDALTGVCLCSVSVLCLSFYYFHIALMNHNQSENWNLLKLWTAESWAQMTLITSTDIGYEYGYVGSMLCLWLNYHTVHHLLPTVDMSHHQNVQKILKQVSEEYGLQYSYKPALQMYLEMVETFSVARAYALIQHG